MTFDSRFFTALVLILLPTVLFAVPLHPDTEAELRATGQFESVRSAYLQAKSNGVDQPTERPLDVRAMNQMDITELKVLTILVDFSDNPANPGLYPPDHYEDMLYSQGSYITGSLRDYYLENSWDDVDIVGEVVGWYRMPLEYSWYVNNNYGFGSYPQNAQKLTEDAVYAANPDVDFSQYDNDNDGYVDALFVVHAGPGAESTGSTSMIWSHAWACYNVPYVDGVRVASYSQEPEDGHIGVFGHELGHALFGLPDLYDYDYDSHGTGQWSMMSGGCWGGGGLTPVHLDAWSKIEAGFCDPINVTEDMTGVTLPSSQTDDVIYRLWTDGQMGPQYYLVENRRRTGFNVSLPGEGLMIYHVEEQYGSNNNQWYPGYMTYGHYLVAVEQADGDYDLERYYSSGDAGDPWPGSTGNTAFDLLSAPNSLSYDLGVTDVAVTNISPSAELMTADFCVGNFVPHGQDVTVTPEAMTTIVPEEGGSFSYSAEIVNRELYSVNTQYWTMILLPGGAVYGPVIGPVNLTLPADDEISGDFLQNVPGRAPSGTYTLISYIGTYPDAIVDSSAFNFHKGPAGPTGGSNPQLDGWEAQGGFGQSSATLPSNYVLHGAYPNPFNPSTTISYDLPDAASISLKVYDVQGKEVAALFEGWQSAGRHEVSFNAAGLVSGVYMVRITGGNDTKTCKLILMK